MDRMDVDMINLSEFGLKAKSKVELYRMLTVEGHLFLPPYRYCPVDFMALIATGEKKALEAHQVIIRTLPHIPGLRNIDLLEFFVKELDAEVYLLPKWKMQPLDRDWLSCMCNSLDNHTFSDFVDKALENWKTMKLKNSHLNIKVTSKFAKIFGGSKMISTSKGRSNLLLNRRLKVKKLEDEKADQVKEKANKDMIQNLKDEIQYMKDKIDELNENKKDAEKNANILAQLYEKSIIDSDGNIL